MSRWPGQRLPAILLLACAGGAGAAELEVAARDAVLRPGIPWCATVRLGAGAPPPLRLEARLEAGGRLLAADAVELPSAAPLAAGVRLALVPGPLPGGSGARLSVRLSGSAGTVEGGCAVPTTASLRAALERVAAPVDPSPWRRLAIEQVAELLLPTPPTLGELVAAARHLEGLERGMPPPDERAWIDPVDASVQPWRLHRPAGPVQRIAVLLRPQAGLRKCAWPVPPAAWLAAASAAGALVVEPYPAGDADGRGVLARRATALLAEVAGSLPADLPRTVVAVGGGDLADPAAWRRDVSSVPEPAQSALTAWAQGPFVVVVGSSEHLAAARANRLLADAFVVAWAAHAQGIPPVVDERSFAPERWSDHHLVLIGNPRSNRVAAGALSALPVEWDDRLVSWSEPGGHGELPRAGGYALALAAPLGAGRWALLLDGVPAWAAGGLPLAGEAGDWFLRGPEGARRAGGAFSR